MNDLFGLCTGGPVHITIILADENHNIYHCIYTEKINNKITVHYALLAFDTVVFGGGCWWGLMSGCVVSGCGH